MTAETASTGVFPHVGLSVWRDGQPPVCGLGAVFQVPLYFFRVAMPPRMWRSALFWSRISFTCHTMWYGLTAREHKIVRWRTGTGPGGDLERPSAVLLHCTPLSRARAKARLRRP